MKELDKFIKLLNEGVIPPLPKGQRMGQLNPPALPDETITWIGTIHSDSMMFSRVSSAHGFMDVSVGISPYRIIFCGGPILSKKLYSRSYWFDVDFEDNMWQRGTLRKKEYNGLSLAPPKYKKGILSREIVLANYAKRTDGRTDKTFDTTLSDLKWLNPRSGKFEGGKADELFKQIMEFYDQRRTITLRALILLTGDPEALEEEMYTIAPAEGQAIKVEDASPPQAVAEAADMQPVVVPEEKPKSEKKFVPTPTMDVCPSCGKALKPGARFCGNCGARFDEELPAPVKEPEPEQKPEPEPKPKTKAKAKPKPKSKSKLEPEPSPTPVKSAKPQPKSKPKSTPKQTAKTKTKPSPAAVETPELKVVEPAKKGQPPGTSSATTCPSCGKPLRSGAIFCGSCGTRLEQTAVEPVKKGKAEAPAVCPNCGKPVESGWKGCPFCGRSLQN